MSGNQSMHWWLTEKKERKNYRKNSEKECSQINVGHEVAILRTWLIGGKEHQIKRNVLNLSADKILNTIVETKILKTNLKSRILITTFKCKFGRDILKRKFPRQT